MKAQGTTYGSLKMLAPAIVVLALVAVAGMAEEPAKTSAASAKASSIPALSVKYTKDQLTLSWPKSATNWNLSEQSVEAKSSWKLVPASLYHTNSTDVSVTTPLPEKMKFYRLIKLPPGFNRPRQAIQAALTPPMPSPSARRARPPGVPPRPNP